MSSGKKKEIGLEKQACRDGESRKKQGGALLLVQIILYLTVLQYVLDCTRMRMTWDGCVCFVLYTVQYLAKCSW